jgi:tripartite-type tricarboxylate transporter receptor subunit TctC
MYARTLARLGAPCAAVLAGVLLQSPAARADDYPSRPIRMIVATEAGGSVDFAARLVAQKLSERWPRGVVVENKPGAGGIVGTQYVAQAAPDGYTLGIFTTSYTTNAATNKHLPFDPLKDLVPIVPVDYSTYVLVCNPSLPVHSVADLIALAKKEPGTLNYASLGVGGSIHLAMELLDSLAGIRMNHIPYKGTASATTALIGGQVQATIISEVAAIPMARAGKLRILAATGNKRSPLLPDVPTIAQTVPGYEFTNWFGIMAPKGTPRAVIDAVQSNVQWALQSKDVHDAMLKQGLEPAGPGEGPAQLDKLIREQIDAYSKLAQRLDIHLD